MQTIYVEPINRRSFAPFGDIIQASPETKSFPINQGNTRRFHDLATAAISGEGARTIISIFRGRPYVMPLTLKMVERHPLGSQAFIPLKPARFLAIVAPDNDGIPGTPKAFLVGLGQGVNYFTNIWHGVLTPLDNETDFLVVDREGAPGTDLGENLQTFDFTEPYEVQM